MMQRAVAVREVARDKRREDAAAAGSDAEAEAGAAVEAQALRDVLWRLGELHEQAGQHEGAAGIVERWAQAGGDEAVAAERAERLRAQAPEAGAEAPPSEDGKDKP